MHRALRVVASAAWLAALNAACGEDPSRVPPFVEHEEILEPLTVPTVRLVSPPTWAAGDVVTVLGSDFLSPEEGATRLHFAGTFTDLAGTVYDVDTWAEGTWRNAGRIDLIFEPAHPPGGFGHAMGAFSGEVTAVNVTDAQTSKPSEPADATVEVAPSLLVWGVAPEASACAGERIATTLSGETVRIDLEAIGLAAAASHAPLRFEASWVDVAGEPHVVTEELTGGDSTRLDVAVGDLPEGEVAAAVRVNLSVTDGAETRLGRALQIEVGRDYTIHYDGNVRVVELYEPVQVSSCIPGGSTGRNVGYSSSQSESRSRSVSFSANVGISIWIVNLGFGMNVSESVASSESESLSMSGPVYANQYGVFYRQTQRLERLGDIVRRGRCGEVTRVGVASVTDWNWAPDLAVTTNGVCPPAPPSNLPPAQTLE